MRLGPVARVLTIAALVIAGYGVVTHAQRVDVFDGRPTFKENSDRGYFVWRDKDRWHVRWTTLGATRRFTGSIRGLGGRLTDLKRIDVDEEVKVIRPGRPARVVRGPRGRVVGVNPGRGAVVATKTEDHIERVDDNLIRWSTETDDIDGFDFTVGDAVRSLRFDLNVLVPAQSAQVEVGKDNVHPRGNPFTVELR